LIGHAENVNILKRFKVVVLSQSL